MSDDRRIVRVSVGKTNQDPLKLLDHARRLLDTRGRFSAKRGQTNDVFRKKGYLRFVFPDKESANQYQADVEEYCSAAVTTERFRFIGRKAR